MGRRLWMAALAICLTASAAHAAVKNGEPAPDFTLADHTGKSHTLSQYRGSVVLIDFWSAQCPVSARYEERLKALATTYGAKGVITLAIDSNKTEDLAKVTQVVEERQVQFPVLMDPGNQVADLYGGLTTPHIYIVDTDGTVIYQGAIDDEGMRGDRPPKQRYAADALQAALDGRPIATAQTEPFGCSIKRVTP